MAEANAEDQVGLHEDTVAWKDIRDQFRDLLAEALGAVELEEAADAGEGVAAEEEGCAPVVGGCAALNARFNEWPPEAAQDVERQSDESGWPTANGLYQAIEEKLKAGGTERMEEIIIRMLQANTLESYRKMLLHKKYRQSHHLVALTNSLTAEGQSQEELERLMLHQLVGREANNDGEGGEA